ncbi:MAG: metallophosphoesterase, partial [Deltaproteobacteria bacterium]|nr:metallophosphoesterase [Deltaproteobacteria bacterium]
GDTQTQHLDTDTATDTETGTAISTDSGTESGGDGTDGAESDADTVDGRMDSDTLDTDTSDTDSASLTDTDLPDVPGLMFEGTVITARQPGDAFSFALLTDSHIGSDLSYSNQGTPEVLQNIGVQIGMARPDFMINLGDMLDFHKYGFNSPPPDGSITRQAYMNYRTLLGDAIGHVPHFAVIGNWEGENGDYSASAMAWSRQARLVNMPGIAPNRSPQGGSASEDYYAFEWGDALFIILNVQSYTPTPHLLTSGGEGTAEDWTLGEAQMGWLMATLENATAKWRFIGIHHTVGGLAGTEADSAYGRGGGLAAHVGEQALIHQLMIDHGVQIFFYGHDHVFTDMVVDSIHYTLPGSAGAPWMFTGEETGYTEYYLESGWAQVNVGPDETNVQFINLTGDLLYEYTLE